MSDPKRYVKRALGLGIPKGNTGRPLTRDQAMAVVRSSEEYASIKNGIEYFGLIAWGFSDIYVNEAGADDIGIIAIVKHKGAWLLWFAAFVYGGSKWYIADGYYGPWEYAYNDLADAGMVYEWSEDDERPEWEANVVIGNIVLSVQDREQLLYAVMVGASAARNETDLSSIEVPKLPSSI